ncbi:MAG: hypothetical protein MK060_12960 [Blastomonas sp.]|uniref:hypothetical protein n=1 Tax=Blastomonas sp. TaxID=1909299 RepID=UPI00406A4EA8|nr:hypothetical protein [Blastomonas sp.]
MAERTASSEPRFVLGPLTLYAEIGVMEAWLENAAPGDELRYATGPALGREAPAGQLARQWAEEGEVMLFQRRPGPGKPLEYVARRKEPPVKPRAPRALPGRQARPLLPLPQDFAESDEGRMLALLTEAAEVGLACPSNVQLARQLDLNARSRAQYLITKLMRAGLIRVASASSFDGRVVTIVSSGKRTADRQGGAVLWRERTGG